MEIDELEKLLELLCDFDGTYALDGEEYKAIGVLIETVERIYKDEKELKEHESKGESR